jgi:hypothetical protein
MPTLNRRDLLITTGLAGAALAAPLPEKEKLARIASNTWPIRQLFKTRPGAPTRPA